MNWFILVGLIGILGALAGAGFFMLKSGGDKRPNAMAKALALRVALSVTLFSLVWLAYGLGWIEPRGIPVGR